jgi:hypothetical protein
LKTGVELIAAERQEQIEKHGISVEYDVATNTEFQLSAAASVLIMDVSDEMSKEEVSSGRPDGWGRKDWEKMTSKDYKSRLIIAGALIAAEIDRINNGK